MRKQLFSPETMNPLYHISLHRKLERNAYTKEAKKHVMDSRKDYPDIYMSLASLAHEETDNAFRLGVRIFLDLVHSDLDDIQF